MRELQHRLDCTKKPEKRIILIGALGALSSALAAATGVTP